MPQPELWHWLAFAAFVALMLGLDLAVFHRHAREATWRESALWTVVWTLLALSFNGLLWLWLGSDKAVEFLTGYLVEWSLSMDNVFVFAVIFGYFHVPLKFQYRVLFWGVLGAIVMRLAFVLLGAGLLHYADWMMWIFGVFLVYTGSKLALHDPGDMKIEESLMMRLGKKLLRISAPSRSLNAARPDGPLLPLPPGEDGHEGSPLALGEGRDEGSRLPLPLGEGRGEGNQFPYGERFFVREQGQLCATPLFLVLLLVEGTDLLFAVDSVPAIFGVTKDPFIVFTSNIFAILGLRALYFLLAGVMGLFRFLSYGLSAVLIFVGGKMVVEYWYPRWQAHGVPIDPNRHLLPAWLSLLVVVALLGTAIVASLLFPKRGKAK